MAYELPAPLVRYRAILEEGMPPAYLQCRECAGGVAADGLEEMDGGELWRAHDDAAAGFGTFRRDLLESPGGGRRPAPPGDGEASLLDVKGELARRTLRSCVLCERRCGVDRTAGKRGWCGVGPVDQVRISSVFLHMGEEPELVPSLTVFFSGCTLYCAFCQNWDISRHPEEGKRISPAKLARKLASAPNSRGRILMATRRSSDFWRAW